MYSQSSCPISSRFNPANEKLVNCPFSGIATEYKKDQDSLVIGSGREVGKGQNVMPKWSYWFNGKKARSA